MRCYWILLLFSCLLTSCAYKHQAQQCHPVQPCYSLTLLVDAPHLDYSNLQSLLPTMAKHPATGVKDCTVGHAWILLEGPSYHFEGGHSGELGIRCPRYFERVFAAIERGDSNPVRYLWTTLNDGFLQKGPGKHTPTFAARLLLSQESYLRIQRFIETNAYDYSRYSLTTHQCTTFVAAVAHLAGLELAVLQCLQIRPYLCLNGCFYQMWDDPFYSHLFLPTPDALEEALRQAVRQGKAKEVTAQYRRAHPRPFREKASAWAEALFYFPQRYTRFRTLQRDARNP